MKVSDMLNNAGDMRDDFSSAIKELSDGGGGGDQGSEQTEGPEEERDPFDKDPIDGERKPPQSGSRDASGRFVPRTPAQQLPSDGQGAQKQVQQSGVTTPAPKPGESRAPLSWRPEEREGWDTIAPHHKAAIQRRELEVQQALSTTAEARRFHQEMTQVLSPYMHIIQAEGSTPVRAVASLLQTAAALRTAPPGQKAELVANLVREFGVDVHLLDGALNTILNGAPRQTNPMDGILQALDQRLQPVMQFMNQHQQAAQAREQQMASEAERAWNEFVSDPENEFANDVKDMMADLLMVAAQRGQVLSLQDAYRAATLAHPAISQLVANRQQASGAQRLDAAARRAQEAAASLAQSSGAPSQSSQDQGDGSLRSDLLSSMRSLNQRRA